MSTFVLYLVAAGTAGLVTACALPLLRRYAAHLFVDAPGGLKKHQNAVPVLGGLALFTGTLLSLVLIRLITAFPTGTLHQLRGIFIGGILVFLLGIADDLRKPKGVCVPVKLAVQAAAAGALIYYGISIQLFASPWINWPLTFLWVAGLTNAFNLLDIMDGLCVSQAVVCTLGLTIISLPGEALYVNFAALALLGACLAFWPFNHMKRKIFLGDSGATFLGFMIATLSIGTEYTDRSTWGFLAPLFILTVPLFDTGFVSLARLLKKKNPLKGSNDHIALRLKRMGAKPTLIVGALAVAGLFFNILAFTLTHCCGQIALALFILSAVGLGLITLWLLRIRMD